MWIPKNNYPVHRSPSLDPILFNLMVSKVKVKFVPVFK